MNATMSLNAELFRALSCIADDENCMKKVLKLVKKLAAQKEEEEEASYPSVVAEEAEEYRPLSKAEVMENIRQAFKDAKLIREGKMKAPTWEEVRDVL